MREVGYKGSIPYEDKIESSLGFYMTTKPHPNRSLPGLRIFQLGAVKPEVLRKHIESYRQQLQHSRGFRLEWTKSARSLFSMIRGIRGTWKRYRGT
jgi:hypothetical protein